MVYLIATAASSWACPRKMILQGSYDYGDRLKGYTRLKKILFLLHQIFKNVACGILKP